MARHSRRPPEVHRKSEHEIELMRESGRIVARVLAAMREAAAPGVNTAELDRLAEEIIVAAGALPSSKGYCGYPATICADIDDVVVHGIPREDMVLESGQVFGVDLAVHREGYHADAAVTLPIGEITDEKRELLKTTQEALERGIAAAQVGHKLREVCGAIQKHVEDRGYSVVRDLIGHGIGRQYHEAPHVPNFVEEGQFAEYDLMLRPGMTFAIEPMVNMGGYGVTKDADGWTIRTADGLASAHFEHTVAVTKDGPRILTLA